MGQNVGGIDRAARIIVGLVVLSLYFVLGEGVRAWALLGLVPLATGLVKWCPAYLPFGVNSCKRGK
jgi:hypothetical protein